MLVGDQTKKSGILSIRGLLRFQEVKVADNP